MATFKVEASHKPATVQQICCPNCGSHAERHYLPESTLVRVQCGHCDYFMISCSSTGSVLEAYAPGIYARR